MRRSKGPLEPAPSAKSFSSLLNEGGETGRRTARKLPAGGTVGPWESWSVTTVRRYTRECHAAARQLSLDLGVLGRTSENVDGFAPLVAAAEMIRDVLEVALKDMNLTPLDPPTRRDRKKWEP